MEAKTYGDLPDDMEAAVQAVERLQKDMAMGEGYPVNTDDLVVVIAALGQAWIDLSEWEEVRQRLNGEVKDGIPEQTQGNTTD
jgi:hypothetical protein